MRLMCRTAQRSLDYLPPWLCGAAHELCARVLGTTLRRHSASWLQVPRTGGRWYD